MDTGWHLTNKDKGNLFLSHIRESIRNPLFGKQTEQVYKINFHARLTPCSTMNESELLRCFAAALHTLSLSSLKLTKCSWYTAIPNVYSCSGLSPYTRRGTDAHSASERARKTSTGRFTLHIRFPRIQSELHASVHSVGYGKHFQRKSNSSLRI